MGIYEIDDETFEQVIREESREEGREEGQGEGELIRLIKLIQKKVAKGKPLSQIAEETEETEDSIRKYYEIVCASPEMTAKEILQKSLTVMT